MRGPVAWGVRGRRGRRLGRFDIKGEEARAGKMD